MDWFKGPPCDVDNCGSKRYQERSDGRTYCRRGHQVEGLIATQVEEFEIGGSSQPAARRVKRKAEVVEKIGLALSGTAAVELYLHSFQLVLRQQLHWLVKIRRYPVELESVVRDLWAMRLEMLKDSIGNTDENLATQIFSTQSDVDDDDVDQTGRYAARATFHTKLPKLIETLGLCYLGFVLMRNPICFADVRKWVLAEDFVYLRVLHALPTDMKQRLPQNLRLGLEARTGLGDLEKLHTVIHDLVCVFDTIYGMDISAIPSRLLLIRFITELSLPLCVFPAVFDLATLLKVDFEFPLRLRSIKSSQHPEILLMCLLTIIVRLFYPFDTSIRRPRTSTEPAALVVDWDAWNNTRLDFADDMTGPSQRSHEDYLDITEDDVFGMTGPDLDGYLGWFERTWTDSEIDRRQRDADFRAAMYRMFPTKGDGEAALDAGEALDSEAREVQQQLERVRITQAALNGRRPMPEDKDEQFAPELLRPGDRYQQYRRINDVPERGKLFLAAAGNLVGLSMEFFLVALFQTEQKVQRWLHEQRKDGAMDRMDLDE